MSFTRSVIFALAWAASIPVLAQSLSLSTGPVDGRMAMASRPESTGKAEREAADDFVLDAAATLTGVSFTGLIAGTGSGMPTIEKVVIEIYSLYPDRSNAARIPGVPTRTNSPSDVALASLDSSTTGELEFSTSVVSTSFVAANSVLAGINHFPNQKTGGDGPVTGSEVAFDLSFSSLLLDAGHYFLVPQVQMTNGEFYWLSASPGASFTSDLQSWERGDSISPDWLRVGADIAGQSTFNAAFSLTGNVAAVPEPETWALMLFGLTLVLGKKRASNRRSDEQSVVAPWSSATFQSKA